MSEVLDWTHRTIDIPNGGLERQRDATVDECSALAADLGLVALRRLQASYKVFGIAGGGYRLSGTVTGDLDQACVVSLEPVPAKLNAAFDVEFWPEVATDEGEDDASVLSGPDVEAIENGCIPVGRIVFETLSASLDPYPRAQGAEFDWQDPQADHAEKASPFAVLARLKGGD